MPRRDGTGPLGQGELTGGGFGFCAGIKSGLYGTGYGREFGRCIGLGYRCMSGLGKYRSSQLHRLTDKELLKRQKESL